MGDGILGIKTKGASHWVTAQAVWAFLSDPLAAPQQAAGGWLSGGLWQPKSRWVDKLGCKVTGGSRGRRFGSKGWRVGYQRAGWVYPHPYLKVVAGSSGFERGGS